MLYHHGRLEVICGSMFSGKSEELIRRLTRAQIAQRTFSAFKHGLDKRSEVHDIASHNGSTITATPVDSGARLLELVQVDCEVVGIDEVQFFDNDIVKAVCELVDQGKRVIVAGLDLDFRGLPFGCIPLLMAVADCVTKLNAVCIKCGHDAHFSQRLVNNKPAKFSDPLIVVGAQEHYQARCRTCYEIDKSMVERHHGKTENNVQL